MEQIYLSIYLFREETVVLFRDRVRTNYEEMQYLAILWLAHLGTHFKVDYNTANSHPKGRTGINVKEAAH